jgi:hypothetical protein
MLADGEESRVRARSAPAARVALYEDSFNFQQDVLSRTRGCLPDERNARAARQAAGPDVTITRALPHGVQLALIGEADRTLPEL